MISDAQPILTRELDLHFYYNLQTLLDEFVDVFWEHTGLPPSSLYDHKIPLVNNAQLVKIRPYRYPSI